MIALVILIIAGAFASGYISRAIVERAASLPPATRRAIRRDRRRQRLGLADRVLGCRCHLGLGECRMCSEARTGKTIDAGVHVIDRVDPLNAQLIEAIRTLGSDARRARGQADVWDRLWDRVRKEHRRG